MSLLWLNFLVIVPIIAYRYARHRVPRHVFSITGAALGAIITPFGFGLYSWYFLSVLGIIPGMLGLLLVMIHEAPGFHLAVSWGLVPAGEVVSGLTQRTIIEIFNGVIWSIGYGLVGYVVDRFLIWRKN